MTLTAIGIPQISGECPYKVLNSQRVPTRREANERNERDNVTLWRLIYLAELWIFTENRFLPGGSGSSDGGFSNMVDLIGDNPHVPSRIVFSKTRKSCFCIYIKHIFVSDTRTNM